MARELSNQAGVTSHDMVVPAVLIMLLSTVLLSVMQAVVRHLGQDMHAFQITFIRSIVGAVFLLPFILKGGPGVLATRRMPLHFLRGGLLSLATICFFYGLAKVPLAEATVLSLVGVIFGSLGAVIFLGEKMRLRRALATVASFFGVLLILRPGFIEPSLGAYLVVFSSLCWGLALVVVKNLSRTESSLSIMTWSVILTSVISFAFAVPVWRWPDPMEWALGIFIGATGVAGHFAMTRSLQLADATVVLPLNFTRLIWAAAIGFVVFGEVPDRWTVAGAILIAASVAYVARREAAIKGKPPAVDG